MDRSTDFVALGHAGSVDYAGLDVGTTARLLRMRPSTVRVHLTRGRRALAAALRSTYQERSGDD